ncbi:reverse transcriptase domain-containing protein [Tanacetum coccineum]
MIFNINTAIKHSYSNDDTCFSIDVIYEILKEDFNALLDEGSEILHSIEGTILEEKLFTEFDEFMAMTVDENSESESDTEEPPFEKITFNTDYKIKTSFEEAPKVLELKPLPDNLEYVFLEEPTFFPVIISSQLSEENKNKLASVLKKYKRAFSWKTTDIPGICPSFCKHKIQLLEDKMPVVQKQRRLNPNMQEVVKKEIVKLLDTCIIYPIADSPWVSPIHCVPKKGGITVVTNERNELVPTRTVIGWRVCIDYLKLNEATTKDHFPFPFMDQMLERLALNKYFCFLDGFSRYFQIPIDPMDQKKTTFTYPFGTYPYRRMPFGLCNAPATFQRCMLAIFHDMIKESVEVFMDDFFVFRSSFDHFLNNLDKMLQRCEDAHLVLNWKKYHFMVKEGIVLGHKISEAGLGVDKAKIDVIFKLSPPINIKEFDIEIKDRKCTENVAADHLSEIEKEETSDDSEVDDNFPGETLMEINTRDEPWNPKEPLHLQMLCSDGIFQKRDEMPLNNIQAEAKALPTNDPELLLFLKKLFCRFRMPKALISDRGTHFCNKIIEKTMKRYGVNHRFSTSYHPQISGQVENTNRDLKRILEKTVKDNPAIWSRKLDDALWAFRTAYKTSTGTTPYKLIYGKNCRLPFEIEHRAYWALKNCNPDLIAAGEKRMFQLHELNELIHQA